MKVFGLLFLVSVALASRSYHIYSMEMAAEYFEQFIDTFDKQYANEAEKTQRFEVFKQNLKLINQKNAKSTSAVFGITKFSDLTNEEFIAKYTGFKWNKHPQDSNCQAGSANTTTAPDSWDWKAKGVVSNAKDQQLCGSCWAFSAIGNVEAQYAIKHKEMVDLSEQQLVDCDKRSSGCQGTTSLENAFLYLTENSGAMQEKDYPYLSRQGDCKFDASKVKVKLSNCITYQPSSEDELKNIVYNSGPLTIAVDASGMAEYHKHVLEDCPFLQLNHAVLIVGYGTENGTPYWLIKNSWGENFGEDGFIKIKRGVNACGMMNTGMVQSVVN